MMMGRIEGFEACSVVVVVVGHRIGPYCGKDDWDGGGGREGRGERERRGEEKRRGCVKWSFRVGWAFFCLGCVGVGALE